MSTERKTIKEVAVEWAEGLHTEVVLTDDTRDDIVYEMVNIPSTDSQELRRAVKNILIDMTINETIPMDMNDLDIDTIFERAEDIIQGHK